MVGMGLITVQIGAGFGRPAYYLTEQQLQVFMKYSYGEWLQVRLSQSLKRHPTHLILDLCDTDFHQNLDLLVAFAYHGLESFYQALARSHNHTGGE